MSLKIAEQLAKLLKDKDNANELRGLWNTLDTDGDNKVTGKEWGSKVFQNKEVMSKFFGGSTMKEIGSAFNRIDSNNDDALTWDEFASEVKSYDAAFKLADAMKTDEGIADLKALWDTLDKNGDGKVTSKEWGNGVYRNQDVMRKYFGGQELADIGRAFNRIDSDNTDALTWVEFTSEVKVHSVLLSLAKTMDTEEGYADLKALYETLDKNADDKVSSKEWGSAVYRNQDVMKKYFGGQTLAEIGRAFNRLDVDKSGNLSWEEFVRAI